MSTKPSGISLRSMQFSRRYSMQVRPATLVTSRGYVCPKNRTSPGIQKTYIEAYTNAPAARRIARATAPFLESCGDAEDEQNLLRLAQVATQVTEQKSVPIILGSMCIGNLLLQEPRKDTFKQDLAAMLNPLKKDFKFQPTMLPKYFARALKEAQSTHPPPDHDPATPDKGLEASADTPGNDGSGAVPPPPAKKPNFLAAAALIGRKKTARSGQSGMDLEVCEASEVCVSAAPQPQA